MKVSTSVKQFYLIIKMKALTEVRPQRTVSVRPFIFFLICKLYIYQVDRSKGPDIPGINKNIF